MTDEPPPRAWTTRERRRYALGAAIMAVAAIAHVVTWQAGPTQREPVIWLLAAAMVGGFVVAHVGLMGRRVTTVLILGSSVLVVVFLAAAWATVQ